MKIVTLAAQGLETAAFLFHGGYNCGKTHLIGSALVEESKHGKTLFVHTEGEPSFNTLIGAGVTGDTTIVTISSLADVNEVVKEYQGKGFRAVGVDSVNALDTFAINSITGGTRAPGSIKKGDDKNGQAEWGHIKFGFNRAVKLLQTIAPLTLMACPSAYKTDTLTEEEIITPELSGQLANTIIGKFDFVGYIKVVPLSPEKIRREVHFESMTNVKTRCNLPKRPTKPFILEEGNEGWTKIKAELNALLSV